MKYTLLQVGILLAVVAAALAVGLRPAAERWGPLGVQSLYAAATISLLGAVLAAVPLGVTMTYWRQHAPMVAFAGTAIRLLATGGLAVAYQAFGHVHVPSFLVCLLVLYLLLLVVETLLIVYLVVRVFPRQAPKPE
jgi:hypothetical protein